MAKNKENDLFENPQAIQEQINKTEDFVKSNKTVFIGLLAGIALLIGGFFFWKNMSAKKEIEAAKAIFVAEDYFRKDSFDLALKGDGLNKGFEAIANNYSSTKAGELANFYIGVIQLKKGQFVEASKALDKYNTDAFLVQARAYALAGDAYSEQGKNEDAIKFYTKAADSEPNKEFTPEYLFKLALAYEDSKKYADAVLTYEKILSQYPNSDQVDDVKKYLAKVQYLASKKG
jgi:TolA-binding protein